METLFSSGVLKETFCRECRERRLRIQDVVGGGAPLDSTQLDQIHQEFDTLHGGARVLDMPERERFFRTMASYARFLRNSLPEGIGDTAWQPLFEGIDLMRYCRCVQNDCAGYATKDAVALLETMEDLITKAREG